MAKMTMAQVNANLRNLVLDDLFDGPEAAQGYVQINDRQYGIILTDLNGNERYVRVGVVVAEEREDMTARELMQSEIESYKTKQAAHAEKAAAKAKKAEADKAKREAAKAEE